MLKENKLEIIKRNLPTDDPKYIAFKNLKGSLGIIDSEKVCEEIADEIIARYKCNS